VISEAKFFATVFSGNSRLPGSDETPGAIPSSWRKARVSRVCAQRSVVRKTATVKLRVQRNMTRRSPYSNETIDQKQKARRWPGLLTNFPFRSVHFASLAI
jgi:hypothetical protein